MISFFKKRAAKRALDGVNVVIASLYDTFKKCFLLKYQKNGEKYCNELAAAATNEIFGDHGENSLRVFNENRELIINEIKNLGANHPELKRIITDTIRIYIQAKFMLDGEPPANTEEIINNAVERGIFIEGGNPPDVGAFLKW